MNFTSGLFLNDLKVAFRSLIRAKGLAITVVLTLALGIGANAAIFTLVRGILLRPLVNRDESRLIYIRQSMPGIGNDNTNFSVPEYRDIEAGVHSVGEFGDFSSIPLTMVGLGEPRSVLAGIVGGTYFNVMGLNPVLGRLVGPQDDGPKAAGVVVLTYRFWSAAFHNDPGVIGKTVRLGSGPLGTREATVIGVLEPSIPYPAETEIMANLVTSPHHLSATMQDGRVHRMTELFGRLAPGATLDQARAELRTVYGGMVAQHPEAYAKQDDPQITATFLRDQITSGARTVLLVLLAASGLVFVIAVSNVANLILARSVRREGELAVRAALGASNSMLRRTLLAESILLCGAGALLGVLGARPMVAILARYASRFSVRALDLTVDSSMLWVGAGLAIVAAILLAFIPRLPSLNSSQGYGLATGSVRITGGTNRRLQIFAMTQIAASFMLLAGASMLLKTLLDMQHAHEPLDTHRVLAVNLPVDSYGKTEAQINHFYEDVVRSVGQLPGVDATSVGSSAPWRDTTFDFQLQFSADQFQKQPGEEYPRAKGRIITPGFFASLGMPVLEGRDINDLDRKDKEPVVIISQSLAQKMFPGRDPLNRHVWWTDPVLKFIGMDETPMRVVGVVADIDDQHVIQEPTLTIYSPLEQQGIFSARLFVHTHGDPYALVTPITKLIRGMSADQPIEKPATLEDIRAEVLTPDRLNSVVFGGFAMVALLIAVVGVAGVLAFSVSARTREFGIRLAIGSQPTRLLAGVIGEGAVMAAIGVAVGAGIGYLLARLAGSYLLDMKMPSPLPVVVSALILLIAAVAASALPAARAARVDVIQALRSE
ncbi:MAG TPA: ADOP family duplicated permease [Candidatus Acidoferrum sp.]